MPQLFAVIAEYDPFHNGHGYHLSSLRSTIGDCPIAVILGSHFSQRGEPAAFDPLDRASMALKAGADLVVNLPPPFCCHNAGVFAFGAVTIAQSLGANGLSFGCENDNINILRHISSILVQEDVSFKTALSSWLAKGVNFASATAKAVETVLPESRDLLRLPNVALAVQYLTQGLKIGWEPQLVPVLRHGDSHHSQELNAVSGSQLRKHLRQYQSIYGVPESSAQEIRSALKNRQWVQNLDRYWIGLQNVLLRSCAEEIARRHSLTEGFEHKIYNALFDQPQNFEDFVEKLACKRYTRARVKRLLLHIYLNLDAQLDQEAQQKGPAWIRLLGASEKGRQYLAQNKKSFTLPMVTRAGERPRHPYGQKLSQLEDRCCQLWHSLLIDPMAKPQPYAPILTK